MPFCSQCGADITGVSFCSKCGAAVAAGAAESTPASPSGGQSAGAAAAAQPAAQPSSQGVAASSDNVMGALAYVTVIPAIIFLIVDPYKGNPFIRFHSFQSIFFCIAAVAINIAMGILSFILGMVGLGLLSFLGFFVYIGFFVLWIVLLIKAFQGQQFKLPVIGDFAQKQV